MGRGEGGGAAARSRDAIADGGEICNGKLRVVGTEDSVKRGFVVVVERIVAVPSIHIPCDKRSE